MVVEGPSSQGQAPLKADHGGGAVAAKKGEAAASRPGAARSARAGRSDAEAPAGKYVYGVIRSPKPPKFLTRGIDERGESVHTVHYKDLAAVVCASAIGEYEPSRRNMRLHTLVLEEAIREFTVLPVRFSTVAPSAEAVQERMLKQRYDELSRILDEMDGRVELGLKSFWYEGVIFREVVEEYAPIRRLRDSLVGRTSEETYYERIRLGELVEAAMRRKREHEAGALLVRLKPLARETRINDVLIDRMILNAAFLVERSRVAEFDEAVRRLDAEMGERVLFKYVGPMPPYNFVKIAIRWED